MVTSTSSVSSEESLARFATDIRRFARYGWVLPVAVILLLVTGDIIAYRQSEIEVPVAIPGLITALWSNLLAVGLMWFLRPRMLANADRIEGWAQEEAERSRHAALEQFADDLAALIAYRHVADDLRRIERQLRED